MSQNNDLRCPHCNGRVGDSRTATNLIEGIISNNPTNLIMSVVRSAVYSVESLYKKMWYVRTAYGECKSCKRLYILCPGCNTLQEINKNMVMEKFECRNCGDEIIIKVS